MSQRGRRFIFRLLVTLAPAIVLMLATAASTAQAVNLQGTWEYSRVNTRGENYLGKDSDRQFWPSK